MNYINKDSFWETDKHNFTILLGARAMKLASFAEWRQGIVEHRKILYNGEFDPGSGWTLATGLTHASRGETILKACFL